MDNLRFEQTMTDVGAILDTLLPGDDHFPPASTTGIQSVVLERLTKRIGPGAPAEIVESLGGDFADSSASQRIEAMSAFAEEHPMLFAEMRFAAYLAYYETPQVIAALQKLGHQYNRSPLPDGYSMEPFDPAIGIPARPRGSYKSTHSIERLDISSLADLGLRVVADGQS